MFEQARYPGPTSLQGSSSRSELDILVCFSVALTCSIMPPCPYSVEFVDQEEDLLPEVIQGDFLWLQNMQDSDDMYYDTRVKSANVFMRGSLAVLKLSLQVPKSFNLDRGAQFLLRLRLNRVTLRR